MHFYPKLRYIAFNRTRHALTTLAHPGGDAYAEVEERVLADALSSKPRLARRYLHSLNDTRPEIVERANRDIAHAVILERRANDVKAELRGILANIGPMLEQTCGGTGTGRTNGLPWCSWEKDMKSYILTFP